MPATRWLAERFWVTGVDISARQLELARDLVPGAGFLQADMANLEFAAASIDAVVALFAIIHVPRTEQRALSGKLHRWLKPGGYVLVTLPVGEWEGQEENWQGWGAPMWRSHHDAPTSLRMLQQVGFEIEAADLKRSGNEQWLWGRARKRVCCPQNSTK